MTTERLSPPAAFDWPPPDGARANRVGLATAALVLGIVSLVLNVLLVPTALSIVFGALALGRGTVARTRAIVGIALGGVGFLAFFVQIAVLIPLVIAAAGGGHHVPFHLRMAAWIQHDVNAGGEMTINHVVCPVAGQLFVGKEIVCTADRAGVGAIRIDVTFTSDTGAYTYVTDSSQAG